MKRICYKLCLLTLLALFNIPANAQFKVVGYVPTWGGGLNTPSTRVDFTKLTHINIAFVNPTNDAGDLEVPANLANFVAAAHDNNVKVLISMAGATINATRWANLQNDANRAGFVAKIAAYLTTYNLDGVDIDLEGNNIGVNYEKFILALDAALPSDKLLTAAVAQWNGYAISDGALEKFDFINLMAYDATGPWNVNVTGQHSSMAIANRDLNYWRDRGVANEDLILGVPFYGHWFNTTPDPNTAGSTEYSVIVASYPGSENTDVVNLGPNHNVWYNGIPTIKEKTSLALEEAGGIMIWQILQDASGPKSLLNAIDEVVDAAVNNTAPIVSITSPANNATFTEEQTITIDVTATDPDETGAITKVIFYAGTTKIAEDIEAPFTFDWIGAGSGTYALTVKALDNAYGQTVSDPITITVGPGTEAPFGGTHWAIPGKIEAENFNIGGQGVSYNDITPANQGGAYRTGSVDIEACEDIGAGYNVGYIATGEWLQYHVNVTTAGSYDIKVRVASQSTQTKKLHIEMDEVNISGDITIPNTNGWQKWQTVTVPGIALTEGEKTMRLVLTGEFNLNYVEFADAVLGTSNPVTSFTHFTVQPNPFNEYASINFSLKNAGETKVIIFDEMGKEIKILANQFMQAGSNTIDFDASSLHQGIYMCQIIQNGEAKILKLVKQ